MTLARSSVLHYWSSRYGPLPIIGGKPTHGRNSAGSVADARGELYDAIVNTPRFLWETDRATVAAERRAMLLLEPARTNSVPWSVDFSNAAWAKVSMSIATGVADPKGGTNACTLTATSASAQVYQILAAGASLARTNALWMRRRTGSGTVQLTTPLDGGNVVTLTSQWQRFMITGAASTSRILDILIATSGDAIDVYNAQQEDGPYSTSDVVNPGAVATTRAADSFWWRFPPPPQAMMVYLRYVEGTSGAAVARLLNISDTLSTVAFLALYTSGAATLQYSAAASVSSAVTAVAAIGDTVELVGLLTPSAQVQLIQSVNAAAVTNGALSAGTSFPAAFSDSNLWLNSVGASDVGARKYADLRIVKYADVVAASAQGIMDELRAFELGPNGDTL